MQACLKVSCSQQRSRDPKLHAPRMPIEATVTAPCKTHRICAGQRLSRGMLHASATRNSGVKIHTAVGNCVAVAHSRAQESLQEHRHINLLMATQPEATVDEAFSEDTPCEKVGVVKAKVAKALQH